TLPPHRPLQPPCNDGALAGGLRYPAACLEVPCRIASASTEPPSDVLGFSCRGSSDALPRRSSDERNKDVPLRCSSPRQQVVQDQKGPPRHPRSLRELRAAVSKAPVDRPPTAPTDR